MVEKGKGGVPGGAGFPQIERQTADTAPNHLPRKCRLSGTRVGLARDSGWGAGGLQPPPRAQVQTHAGPLRALACSARPSRAHTRAQMRLSWLIQAVLHGNRLGDRDTRFRWLTPLLGKGRHAGDPAAQAELQTPQSARVSLRGLVALLPVSCLHPLMVFTGSPAPGALGAFLELGHWALLGWASGAWALRQPHCGLQLSKGKRWPVLDFAL